VKRTLGAAGVVAAAVAAAIILIAGSGGGSSSTAPIEDPGQVMKAVVSDELSGRQALTYKLLVREQRKLVSARLYSSCLPGLTMQASDVSVAIVAVKDESYSVPALGQTNTKAVRYRIDFHDGGEPIVSTGHLIAQDGHWRWTLSPKSFHSFSNGSCP